MVGCGMSRSFSQLLAWRWVTGLGSALQMSGAQLYLADISACSNRARIMGTNQARETHDSSVFQSLCSLVSLLRAAQPASDGRWCIRCLRSRWSIGQAGWARQHRPCKRRPLAPAILTATLTELPHPDHAQERCPGGTVHRNACTGLSA